MKPTAMISAVLGLALAATSSALAYSPNESAPPAVTPAVATPLPTEVVHPANLPRSFKGGLLMVEFSLDDNGRPRDIKLRSPADRAVRDQIVKAFKQWKFDPSAAGTGRRYVLPLDVVMRS